MPSFNPFHWFYRFEMRRLKRLEMKCRNDLVTYSEEQRITLDMAMCGELTPDEASEALEYLHTQHDLSLEELEHILEQQRLIQEMRSG